MTIINKRTIINLTDEEKRSVTQTIQILRSLFGANMAEEDYEAITSGCYCSLDDMADSLELLFTNLKAFDDSAETDEKIGW